MFFSKTERVSRYFQGDTTFVIFSCVAALNPLSVLTIKQGDERNHSAARHPSTVEVEGRVKTV